MSYVLNQLNQPQIDATNPTQTQIYMTLQETGTAKRRQNTSDNGVSGGSLNPFYDECVQFNKSLTTGSTYYFHAKIKRLTSSQKFYIYLVNYDDTAGTDTKTQYLKTIEVQAGDESDWVDFEMLFSPLMGFDCLLFQLQRTIDDYRTDTRYPRIVYEEFSLVNNAITTKITAGVELTKMGVQSHPGLIMCVNGEEIHIGRSGTYEVRNGIISVDFFSVIVAAEEDYNGTNPLTVDGQKVTLTQYLSSVTSENEITSSDATNSKCIFGNSKLRGMDAFVLDYMYKEK
jgi:hypothetical protein